MTFLIYFVPYGTRIFIKTECRSEIPRFLVEVGGKPRVTRETDLDLWDDCCQSDCSLFVYLT